MKTPAYAELAAISNFSFLEGGSHAEELVETANALGLRGIGIADRNSFAGIVRAHEAWRSEENRIRVRMVEYSPGYVADHWCSKGHIILCLEGEMKTTLQDGRVMPLKAGMSYQVADGAEAHRSHTATGAKLFIVD